MFFQYAAWGAWTPLLSATISSRLNATGTQVGAVYGVLWLACILTPFLAGQIVDRYMASQRFLGIAAVICTGSAWMMAQQQTIGGLIGWMWVWSLAFAPTIGITNSIAFYHLRRSGSTEDEIDRDYSLIRTAGTIGWIVASLVLLAWFRIAKPVASGWAPFEECQLAAVFGAVLSVVAFLIPNTPPAKEGVDPLAFTKAFALFKTVPGFAAFMAISLLISTEFQFYYVTTGPFLEQGLKIPHELISPYKSIAQYAEIFCLGVLTPISLKKLGLKGTLVIGALAWPARYFLFALGGPVPLVLASMSLHGVGFAFVFVTSYLYLDRVAPADIRASAQSLLTLVTLGLGNYLGTLFCGWWQDQNTKGDVTNWTMVFVVPAILTILCAIAFALFFREPAARGAGNEAPAAA